MGSGVSTLMRVRKVIVIRAYNIQKQQSNNNNISLDQQFKHFSYKNSIDNDYYININGIRDCLKLDETTKWIDNLIMGLIIQFTAITNDNNELLQQDNLNSYINNIELNYKQFIDYLESGKPIKSIINNNTVIYTNHNNIPDPPNKVTNDINTTNPPDVPENDNNLAIVVAKPMTISLLSKDLHKIPFYNGQNKETWRKREIVKHERIVQYTTVDALGELQELIEKEIQQTEILHMECRETGEFAHRETTHLEQLELFNNEVVNEKNGTEEYVHMKSLNDEIEYMQSDMPKKDDDGVDDMPQSPRVANNDEMPNDNTNEFANTNDTFQTPNDTMYTTEDIPVDSYNINEISYNELGETTASYENI